MSITQYIIMIENANVGTCSDPGQGMAQGMAILSRHQEMRNIQQGTLIWIMDKNGQLIAGGRV